MKKKVYNQPETEITEVAPMYAMLDASINEGGGGGGIAGAPGRKGDIIP